MKRNGNISMSEAVHDIESNKAKFILLMRNCGPLNLPINNIQSIEEIIVVIEIILPWKWNGK